MSKHLRDALLRLTLRDVDNRRIVDRVPRWRQHAFARLQDPCGIRLDGLVRSFVVYRQTGGEAALAELALTASVEVDDSNAGRLANWYDPLSRTIYLGSLADSEALDHADRAVVAASRIGPWAVARSRVVRAFAFEQLGMYHDATVELEAVVADIATDDTDRSLARQVQAIAFDRLWLVEEAFDKWREALDSEAATNVENRAVLLVGFVRSGLANDQVAPLDLRPEVDELAALAELDRVPKQIQARAGFTVGIWSIAIGDWASARSYAERFFDRRGVIPRDAAEGCILAARVALHDGCPDVAEAILLSVDLGANRENLAVDVLQLLLTAQRATGRWEAVSATNAALDKRTMAAREHRQRVRYHGQMRRIDSIEKRRRELEDALRDRDGLMNIVAHELRAPLARMGLQLDRCRIVAPDGSVRRPTALPRSYENLKSIVTTTALLGQVETGEVDLRQQPTPIQTLLDATLATVESSIKAKDQLLVIDQSPPELSLVTDPSLLGVIVENYLANATKFCGRGDIISVAVDVANNAVTIRVSDTGPGFRPDEAPALFDPYPHLAALPTEGEMSNGLGLYLASKIATFIGAELGAHSAGPGTGASFWVTVPINPETRVADERDV